MNQESLNIIRKIIWLRSAQILVNDLYKSGEFIVPIHLAMGHESIAVAVDIVMQENDSLVLTHRNIHYNLSRIGTLKEELYKTILNHNITASLFSINSHLCADYEHIMNDIKNTRKLVIIDDSKSKNKLSDRFIINILDTCELKRKKVITRSLQENDFYPCKDTLEIDYNSVVDFMIS